MNGIEKITARILSDAQAQAQAIQAEGEARVQAIGAEYEKKAREEYESLTGAGTQEAEQRVQRMDRTARLEAKKDVLAVKQELIAAAYAQAKERVLALPLEEYGAFLARLAAEAASTGTEEVILNETDRARVGRQVVEKANAAAADRGIPGSLTLSEATRPISGGLVLRQGDVEVNCTLDALLDQVRGTMDAEVAAILFR